MTGRRSTVDARRATVVAYYGPKPVSLVGCVQGLQAMGREILGSGLRPRPLPEVHATLIGLETPAGDVPGWPELDVAPLAAEVVAVLDRVAPRVQFGGFAPDNDSFRSCGHPPYERGFGVYGDQVVLIGWTTGSASGCPDPVVVPGELRRECERFGVRHKYHGVPGSLDCDLHLVIGSLDPRLPPADRRTVESAGRAWLAAHRFDVELTADTLSLVEYERTGLPATTSRVRALREIAGPPDGGNGSG